uniref:Uncharacterized protein n=1 Tax=Panstrongylus lignarius TaxID=156445 RepID=A0A224XX09_9HEMI
MLPRLGLGFLFLKMVGSCLIFSSPTSLKLLTFFSLIFTFASFTTGTKTSILLVSGNCKSTHFSSRFSTVVHLPYGSVLGAGPILHSSTKLCFSFTDSLTLNLFSASLACQLLNSSFLSAALFSSSLCLASASFFCSVNDTYPSDGASQIDSTENNSSQKTYNSNILDIMKGSSVSGIKERFHAFFTTLSQAISLRRIKEWA